MASDIKYLHPQVQQYARLLLNNIIEAGLDPAKVTDTIRTQEEQNTLYEQGRTKPGEIITNVKYPQSNHNWGIAFDICRNIPGRAYDNSDGWFDRCGEIGKSIGLYWGGDFTDILDRPHYEYQGFGLWRKLQDEYGTPENFIASWEKEQADKPNQYVKSIQVSLNDDNYTTNQGKALVEDGILGYRTKEAMAKVHLKRYTEGAMPGWVQTYLNILKEATLVYDGKYGRETEKAVRVFQAQYGLVIDGITGINVLSTMLDHLITGIYGNGGVQKVAAANGANGILNVRSGPGTNYSKISYDHLGNGNLFDVINQTKGTDGKIWYKILIEDQHVGWVRADLTK